MTAPAPRHAAGHRQRALVTLLRASKPLSTRDVALAIATPLTTARDALDVLEHRGEVVRCWDRRAGASKWRLPRIEATQVELEPEGTERPVDVDPAVDFYFGGGA